MEIYVYKKKIMLVFLQNNQTASIKTLVAQSWLPNYKNICITSLNKFCKYWLQALNQKYEQFFLKIYYKIILQE